MNVKLIVVSGESNAREVPIKRLPMTIGRDPSADLRIVHSQISRRHCQFFLRNGRLALRDLRSSNGTFVDGKPIDEASVKPGSTIMIGPLTFRVEVTQSPKPAKPKAAPAKPAPAKGAAPAATAPFDPLGDAPATGEMAATQEFAPEALFSPDDATMTFSDVTAAAGGAEAAPPGEEDFFAALADGGAPVEAAPAQPVDQSAMLFDEAEAAPAEDVPAESAPAEAEVMSFDAVEFVDTPLAEPAAPAEPVAETPGEVDFLAMLGAADTPAEAAAAPEQADVPEAAPEAVAETMMFEPAAEAESPFNFLAETEAAAEEQAAAVEATPIEELPAEAEDVAFNFLAPEAATPAEEAPAGEPPAAAAEDEAFNFLSAAEETPTEAAPAEPEVAAAAEDDAFNFLSAAEAAPTAEATPIVEAAPTAPAAASEDDAFNFLTAAEESPAEATPEPVEPEAVAEDNAFNFLAAEPEPIAETMMFEPAAAAPAAPAPEPVAEDDAMMSWLSADAPASDAPAAEATPAAEELPAAPVAEPVAKSDEDDFFAALAGEAIESTPAAEEVPAEAPAADPLGATTMFDPTSAGDDFHALMTPSAEPAAEEALFDPLAAPTEPPPGEPSDELAEPQATGDDAAFDFLSAVSEPAATEHVAPSAEAGATPVDLDTGWPVADAAAADESMFAPDDLREPESVAPAADADAFWNEMSGGTPAPSAPANEFQPADELPAFGEPEPANEFQLADEAELAGMTASAAPEHPDVGFPIDDVHGNTIDDQSQAPHGWPVEESSPVGASGDDAGMGAGYHAFAPKTPLGAIALDDTPVLSNKITYAASDLVITSPAAPAGKLGASPAVPAAAPRRKKRRPKVADVGTGALDTLDVFFPPILTAPPERPAAPAEPSPAEVMSEALPVAGVAVALGEPPAEGAVADEGLGFAEALMLGARATELESETGLISDAADPFCETEQAIPADLPPTGSDDLTAWFDAGQGAPSVEEGFAEEPAAEAAPFDPMADEPLAVMSDPLAAAPVPSPAAAEDDFLSFLGADEPQAAAEAAPLDDLAAEPELFAPVGDDPLADQPSSPSTAELTEHEALSTEADALNLPNLNVSDAPAEEVDLTAMWGAEATIQEAPAVPPTSTEDVAFDFLSTTEEPAAEAVPFDLLADEPVAAMPEVVGEPAAPATPDEFAPPAPATDEDPFAAFLSEQPAASEPEFNFAAEEPAPVAEVLPEAVPPAAPIESVPVEAASFEPASAEDVAFDFLSDAAAPAAPMEVAPFETVPFEATPASSGEDLPLDSLLDDLPTLEDAEEGSGSVPDLAGFLGDAPAEPPAAEAPAPEAESPSRSEDDELAQFLKDLGN